MTEEMYRNESKLPCCREVMQLKLEAYYETYVYSRLRVNYIKYMILICYYSNITINILD